MRLVMWCAGVMLIGLLSACGGEEPTGTLLPLSTSDWQPGDDSMAAEVRGRLAATDDGCVYLRGPAGRADVVWPAEWSARRQPDGTVNLVDPDGDVVAHTGQRISTGGGVEDYRISDLACSAREDDVRVAETLAVQEDEVVVLQR